MFIWNRPTNSISDYIYNSGRNYEFFLSNNSNNYSYMDNTWHHLAWVFGNTATHRLYIDGVLFGEITTVPYNLNANGTGSTLFHADWAGSAFNVIGNIDDVRMYNHVLTAAEISSLYGSGLPTPAKTPVLWYTFDDWTSGQTIIANKGNLSSMNASLINGASIVTETRGGRQSQCLSLNASLNQYMQMPSFAFGGISFSICFWYKCNSNIQNARICDFGNGAADQNIFVAFIYNTIAFGSVDTVGGSNGNISLMTYGTSCDGVWRHIAIVCTFSTMLNSTYTIYINGTVTLTFAARACSNSTRTLNYLGRSNWITDPYYTGMIDDFRLYNTTLTSAEINTIYASS